MSGSSGHVFSDHAKIIEEALHGKQLIADTGRSKLYFYERVFAVFVIDDKLLNSVLDRIETVSKHWLSKRLAFHVRSFTISTDSSRPSHTEVMVTGFSETVVEAKKTSDNILESADNSHGLLGVGVGSDDSARVFHVRDRLVAVLNAKVIKGSA